MATTATRREFNRFIKGLISDATELTFPPDAAVDMDNFDLDIKGVSVRRPGIDFEDSYVFQNEGHNLDEAENLFLWESVGGNASKRLAVAQLDKDLVFYNATDTLSDNRITATVNLTTYKLSTATNADIEDNPCSFASGNGKLYVVHPYMDTIVLTYVSDASITVAQHAVRVRDFDGEALVSPFDDLEHKPTSAEMTNAHWYNLANQGWSNRFTELTAVVTGRSTYPSNTEQWQFGKAVSGTTGVESFSYAHYAMQEFGNARAPQGHVVYDAFDKNVTINVGRVGAGLPSAASTATTLRITSTAHGLSTSDTVSFESQAWTFDSGTGCGTPTAFDPSSLGNVVVTVIDVNNFDVTATLTGFVAWCTGTPASDWAQVATSAFTNALTVRPTCNTFFQGRHVCSGVEADGFGSNIYISKILLGDNTDPGRCYQDADPTSEHTNELVASDGLVINIQSMDKCIALVEYSAGFLAFASNGIWYISGGAGVPFRADNWAVNKVSDVKISSERGIVEVEGVPHFWADQGIYKIEQPDLNALPKEVSIVEDKLQTWYDNLGHLKQATVRGAYNEEEHKIVWIYEGSTTNVRNEALMYNVKYESFFPWTFDKTNYRILDILEVPDFTTNKPQKLKFMTFRVSDGFISYSDLSDTDHYDWYTHDSAGVDAAGFIETGHDVVDSAALEAQAKHITMFMRRTEDVYITDGAGGAILDNQSGCLMRVYWDWTDHANAGKWSPQRQVYRFKRVYIGGGVGSNFDNGYPVTVTRNKIKGSGLSLRIRFDTEAGKKCEILGWSSNMEQRTVE